MFRKVITLSLLTLSLFISGCGGGSSAQAPAADPFAKNETIFGNISTAGGRTGITLTADRPSIDVTNGQVLVTATVVRDSVPVLGVPVTFSIKAPSEGPAAIEPGLTTVVTDSNGAAITRVSAGNFLTTTNVIVQATTTLGSQSAIATTTFQLVRGGGVIMFTDKAGTAPGEQDNMLDPYDIKGVDPSITPSVAVLQLLPFKVTDANGNPRVGVPITLSVYSISGQAPGDVTVDFLVDPTAEPGPRTITTDSAGTGIFNVAVRLKTPPLGSFNAASIVFKAATNDPIPATSFVGGTYSVTATSTASDKTGITLAADRSSIDVANGQVLVTATVVRDSVPVYGVPVTFSIKAPTNGPAAIEPGLTTVFTDSNGVAMTRVSAGNFLTTTNVIVQATAALGSQPAVATTTFQLVRGGGVIMFTDKAVTAPGEQDNMLDPYEIKGVDPAIVPSVAVLQLLPFKVTDANGNPRVGVPITLSVYSISGQAPGDVTVDFLVDPAAEPSARTITTDSSGMGIFNVAVRLETPSLGGFSAASIVFKATTNDPIPATSFVGGTYSVTAKEPPAPPSQDGPITALFKSLL